MVVEGPVLTAVDGLLADEAGDLALELRVGDLVAVVADRSDEEVLAVGEHRRERRHHVADDQVAVGGEVLRQVRSDSSKEIRRVGTLRGSVVLAVLMSSIVADT